MLALYLITHYLLPHESNDHKPKILHSSTLFIIVALFIIYQAGLYYVPRAGLRILGYAANISVDEVVRLTNERRAQNGLAPLVLNESLSNAAKMKGEDMLDKDYWAHVSPEGVEPWKFFVDSGYKYRYAGENLARDFSNASSAVDAWMASTTHKDNLLSSRYQEIGVAVLEGDLAGVDTTLIIQLFGTPLSGTGIASVPEAYAQPTEKIVDEVEESPQPVLTEAPLAKVQVKQALPPLTALAQAPQSTSGYSVNSQVLISPFRTTKGISLVVVGLLIMVFTIDAVLVSRRKIARVAGRTFAHISFLGMILAIALILRAGRIL